MRKSPALRHCTNRRHAQCPIMIPLLFAGLLLGGCCSYRPSGSISGRVVDPQDHAVAGVEVRLGDRRVAVTDRSGKFAIRAGQRSSRIAVSFSAPKFMSTTRIYDAAAGLNGNTVVIWPRATPARLRASDGGALAFNGATIVFPPDIFVDSKGRQVKGDVNVSVSVLDITDPRQLASAPGDFTARMRDGSIRSLETFGLFELVVTDGRGRSVEFAPDRTARVELNVPEGRREVPRSVGSFSFDERSGRWNERSSFQAQSSQGQSPTFVTEVGLSGWWNADLPLETTCLRMRVLSCRGCEADSVGVKDATVTATGTDYTGAVSTGTTDGSGFVCLPVKKAAHVQLDVSYVNANNVTLQSNPLDVATDPNVLDSAMCSNCPLVTATHVVDPGFSNNLLTTHNPSVWCKSNGWNKTPFASAWLNDKSHVDFSASGLTLTLNNTDGSGNSCDPKPDPNGHLNCEGAEFASGEYKTTCFHGYGTYSAKIAPIPSSSPDENSGTVAGFFTYTHHDHGDHTKGENNTSGWDEIDIEILGRKPNSTDFDRSGSCTHSCNTTDLVVQTNYIAKGYGINANEQTFCIPYGTHTYSFTWTANSIAWSYVDSTSNTTYTLRTEQRGGTKPCTTISNPWWRWPTQPGRVYMNLWAVDSTGHAWAGQFNYNNKPRSVIFSNVSVP